MLTQFEYIDTKLGTAIEDARSSTLKPMQYLIEYSDKRSRTLYMTLFLPCTMPINAHLAYF
ncbi:hypothetical protein SAMN05428947_11614 [Mucilaginibacter sp. OK283]|nr:hypothetical protein SAMN05428947_11614 [Mucilaginibacter sp. OK283]